MVAILYGWVRADLAVTGGVNAEDVLKSMMAGAHVAMMTSALLQHGIYHLASVLARPGLLDGRARIRIDPPDEGQHEPALRIRSGGFRARKLYASPQLLYGTKGALRDHNRGDRHHRLRQCGVSSSHRTGGSCMENQKRNGS